MNMKRVFSHIAMMALSSSVLAQNNKEPTGGQAFNPVTVQDLEYQIKYQRAFETALWAMPAVGINALRNAAFRDFGMKDNSISTSPTLTTPAKELLTANSSTPYIVAFTDLKKGPAVLEMPEADADGSLYGQVVDHWQTTIADVGPTGLDKGKKSKYLFVHDSYKEKIPEGYIVVKSPSYRISMVFRSVRAKGKTDIDAYEYSKRLRLHYLNDNTSIQQDFIDPGTKSYSTLPPYDYTYFKEIHDVFTYEEIADTDKWMMGMLKYLGLEKGKPFNPDEKTKKAMNNAMNDLFHYNQANWDKEAAKKKFWTDRQYTSLMLIDSQRMFMYDEGRYIDIDRRMAQWSSATLLPKKLSDRPATDYLMSLGDNKGEPLKPGVTYKVTVPKNMPVNQFWALTVYDHATFAFIYNQLDRTTLSSYDLDKMVKNKNGTVDLYVGPVEPKDKKGKSLASNWIPTEGKRPIPTFRFYGPKEEVYNGKFKMPDFEKVK